MKFRILGTALAVATAVVVTASTGAMAQLKVGFVNVGAKTDNGWTFRHNVGRMAIEKAFGDRVKVTFVEDVPEGADAERVVRQLAATGHKLIFATSFGFMNAVMKVAKQFPNVKFEHATGYKRAKNVSTYVARFYEGRMVAGLIAGNMTKSNIIGYIASFPIPEVVRGINATTLALQSVNPKIVVKVVWVSTWNDPGKEADAAKALFDQGADVILQHTDSPAATQIAQKRNKWSVGQAADQTRFGPKAHLTAIIDVWDDYYVQRTKAVLDGTWKSSDTWGGLKAGMLAMAPLNPKIPADVQAMARMAIADIKSGKRHPFTGPIMNQDGKIMVPAGKVATDQQLLTMNWYVKGVQGKLPK